MSEKIFISGPMTGLSNFNRDRFFVVAECYREAGHVVLNPAILPNGLEHAEYMKICSAMLSVCNRIIMLPNWQRSKGAKIEHEWAKNNGCDITYLDSI